MHNEDDLEEEKHEMLNLEEEELKENERKEVAVTLKKEKLPEL